MKKFLLTIFCWLYVIAIFAQARFEWVINPQYDHAGDFVHGVAGVARGHKYGFIDKQGKIVIKAEYEGLRSFSEGLAAVEKDIKWGFIDKTGKTIIEFKFEFSLMGNHRFLEGLMPHKFGIGLYGFLDNTGKVAIEPAYNNAHEFSESLAAVSKNHKWGFIDKRLLLKLFLMKLDVFLMVWQE
jgi:WG containing repeat